MAIPCFIVNGHDYAKYIKQITPSLNDLDADGSGRNLLDGKMQRKRIATKNAWNVDIDEMRADVMQNFINDMYAEGDYVHITTLDPRENRRLTKEYYFSTINPGIQTYSPFDYIKDTKYKGGSVTITER